jgi:hypothetical protein
MNGNRYYGERAKYGVGFGSALAITISYAANYSISWPVIHGIFGLVVRNLLCTGSVLATVPCINRFLIRSILSSRRP